MQKRGTFLHGGGRIRGSAPPRSRPAIPRDSLSSLPVNAEAAYLFRHALLRDAAYQLQLPGDRARLHALAFHAFEEIAGGPGPALPPLDPMEGKELQPHPVDAFAEELAGHAGLAGQPEGAGDSVLKRAHRHYLRRAAEHAARLFENQSAEGLWKKLSEVLSGSEKADSLRRAGHAAFRAGRLAPAERLLEQALALFRESGHRAGEAATRTYLGGLFNATGRVDLAERFHGQALAIHRDLGNARATGAALGSLANIYRQTGRFDLAEITHGQALALHRETGNRRYEGLELGNLAGLHRETGRREDAEREYGQAIDLSREFLDRGSESIGLGNLAGLFQETGRKAEAERAYDEALAIKREVGNRIGEGIVLGNLASLYQETGRALEAERTYGQALALHREVGNRRSEGVVLGNLASLYAETGRLKEAEQSYEGALALHREVRSRRFEAIHLCDYALFDLARGRAEAARERWLKGFGILGEIGDVSQQERRAVEMRKACAAAGVRHIDQEDR